MKLNRTIKKIASLFFVTLMIASVFAAFVTPVMADTVLPEPTLGNITIKGLRIPETVIYTTELATLPVVTREVTLVRRGGQITNMTVTGPLFDTVLKERFGINQTDLTSVTFTASDGFSQNFHPEILQNRDIILAYLINNTAFTEGDEYWPIRVVVPDERGMFWVRMLTTIEIIDGTHAAQPAFTFSNLNVTPTSGVAPLNITATVLVTNTGGTAGPFNATFVINGTTVRFITGTLDAGANTTVSFAHILAAGNHSIGIDALAPITVTVTEPADIPTMSVIPAINEVIEGENVTVSIIIDNAADIAGGMATIEFNPSTVSVMGIENGSPFALIEYNYSNTEGFIRIAAARADAIGIDQIVFANITFKAVFPNTSELVFTDARTNGVDGRMSDAAFNNGKITVIPRPVSIVITPDMVTMNVTETQQFNATVIPAGADQRVTWSVNNTTIGTIDATGLFTAISEGTVTVTARSVVDSNIIKTATVTVAVPVVVPPTPTSITISPATAILNVTETRQFTAIVSPSGADQRVIWSVNNETIGTIDATGLFTAISEGTVTVTARSVIDTNITETATITVVVLVVMPIDPPIDPPTDVPPADSPIENIHLQKGWNLISTPIALDDNRNSIDEIMIGLNWDTAFTFCGETQNWILLNKNSTLTPLSAVFIYMKEEGTIALIPSKELTSPPSKELYREWNLISLANLESMGAGRALISIYEAKEGRTGYIQIISPPFNSKSWIFIRHDYLNAHHMQPTNGYWVFMENADMLAGFTTTPLI